MGFPRIFSSQVTPPVVTLSQRPKSGDLHDSFGTDFERLGQTSPIASKSPSARPWRVCPERARTVPGGTRQVSYGAWLADSGRDCYAVMGMTAGVAALGPVGDALRDWRMSFLTDVNAARDFEGDRHDALRDIGWGSRVFDVPRLRAFHMGAFQVQANAVAGLSAWIAQQSAAGEASAPADLDATIDAALVERATDLRDTMFVYTAKSIRNRIAQLNCERRDLFLLNDMTREAEGIVGKGGENVPLRLAVRGDKCVLKPAKSRSRFPICIQRARREAAALALMLGRSPNEPVTLKTLRDQGFGRHESTVLLGDARWTGVDMAPDEPWLFGRIRELENAKRSGFSLLDEMKDSVNRPYRAGAPALVVDDSAVDVVTEASLGHPGELLLPQDRHEPLRATSRPVVSAEGAHRRGSSVDDMTADELTPPQTPAREVGNGPTPRSTGRASVEFARTMVDAGPQRPRAQRQVVFAEVIGTDDNARASPLSSHSPRSPQSLGQPLSQSSPHYESQLESRVTRHYQRRHESPSPIALASSTASDVSTPLIPSTPSTPTPPQTPQSRQASQAPSTPSSLPPPDDRSASQGADDAPRARRQDKFEEKANRRPHVTSAPKLPPVLSLKTLRARHGPALRAAEALSAERLQQEEKAAELARSRVAAVTASATPPARSPAGAAVASVAPDVPSSRPPHMPSMPPIRE
ncbi:hypothetical protein [Pandoraea pulmonicola]|uniref:Uncharacterized protein n=1 Tax=Pandoraea pulmonicola TaxID=93221 RepID=A0AAJ4Z9L6_PANPU|nr:hypothetical protein [Pandoraea pulmonicola]AJC21785.1 hypothetical protein RO07_17185 [Pandoraea pulmonicola]SUA89319.1 Uncharacterised protein [Pandoraea pulmonicola]